ncbi:hypothetical protein B0H14DRAFT_3478723 [Mycena olivaceomarginata]|nr:hypothetical protein B0H14DRAFT_3478723 [Mycena olivaceomarginata]
MLCVPFALRIASRIHAPSTHLLYVPSTPSRLRLRSMFCYPVSSVDIDTRTRLWTTAAVPRWREGMDGENVALRCYTVAWNAQPHSERDAAADEKRGGGRRRRCAHAVAFAVAVSSMRLPPQHHRHRRACTLPPIPITTTVRDGMEGKGGDEGRRARSAPALPNHGCAAAPSPAKSTPTPRAKRVYLRTSTVYTSAPPRLTIDPGYCAPCPAASGLDRVAVAIPPRAAFRLPLENKVSSGEGEEAEGRTYLLSPAPSRSRVRASHPQGRAPPLHARRNQNTDANRAYIALISIPPSIPAPYPSLNTFTVPPISLAPPILSPSPAPRPSSHPIIPPPSTRSVGALARSCPARQCLHRIPGRGGR